MFRGYKILRTIRTKKEISLTSESENSKNLNHLETVEDYSEDYKKEVMSHRYRYYGLPIGQSRP